jgi:hypothetical protein
MNPFRPLFTIKKKNKICGVPVQLWFRMEVSIKVPHHFAVGTARVPSGAPVIGTSLSIVGYMGSFNVSLNPFPIA